MTGTSSKRDWTPIGVLVAAGGVVLTLVTTVGGIAYCRGKLDGGNANTRVPIHPPGNEVIPVIRSPAPGRPIPAYRQEENAPEFYCEAWGTWEDAPREHDYSLWERPDDGDSKWHHCGPIKRKAADEWRMTFSIGKAQLPYDGILCVVVTSAPLPVKEVESVADLEKGVAGFLMKGEEVEWSTKE